MALFWTSRCSPFKDLPLKVQAQSIKNNGKKTIYIHGIEEDLPLNSGQQMAFCDVSIDPGCEVDLTKHPSCHASISSPDLDVTIHSDDEINVAIISSDSCWRWGQDSFHPWNGAPLPNGTYTERWGGAGLSKIMAYVGNTPPPPPPPKKSVHVSGGYGMVEVTINITMPKCTCGQHAVSGGGKHSSWCDMEKQTL